MGACSIGFAQGIVLRENISERKADMSVKDFIKHQYRHFNAAVVVDASEAYLAHLARGGKMFMTMALER
jgi:monomeric isocitrate dehydrogenase